MPDWSNKTIKYNPGEKSLKAPFSLFLDLEYILKKYSLFKTTQKILIQKKKLDMSLLVWRYIQDVHLIKKENKLNYYRRKDFVKVFKKIKECTMEIINREKKEMAPLTHEENNFYNKQEICYICKEKFCMDKIDKNYINQRKVKDNRHYTGKFRGAAHSICNLNYNDQKEIPVIIHNATYDTHFIILNQLAIEFKGELDFIGDNMEKIYHFFCTN